MTYTQEPLAQISIVCTLRLVDCCKIDLNRLLKAGICSIQECRTTNVAQFLITINKFDGAHLPIVHFLYGLLRCLYIVFFHKSIHGWQLNLPPEIRVNTAVCYSSVLEIHRRVTQLSWKKWTWNAVSPFDYPLYFFLRLLQLHILTPLIVCFLLALTSCRVW